MRFRLPTALHDDHEGGRLEEGNAVQVGGQLLELGKLVPVHW